MRQGPHGTKFQRPNIGVHSRGFLGPMSLINEFPIQVSIAPWSVHVAPCLSSVGFGR
jgi:hypothetical protein